MAAFPKLKTVTYNGRIYFDSECMQANTAACNPSDPIASVAAMQ